MTSVIPLIIVFVLGLFALFVLRGFVSKLPKINVEKRSQEEITSKPVEEEVSENTPKIQFNQREIQSQKEQNINELNEAILSSPEEAAKLLTSYIRE